MSFTPGPWTIDAEDRICAAGEPILWGWDDGSIVGSEDDLCLVAAAPELLEAAKNVLPYMDQMWPPEDATGSRVRLREALKAAVAKAEGK